VLWEIVNENSWEGEEDSECCCEDGGDDFCCWFSTSICFSIIVRLIWRLKQRFGAIYEIIGLWYFFLFSG
jgi:hypothetical protein